MNTLTRHLLTTLHKLYVLYKADVNIIKKELVSCKEYSNTLIYDSLTADKPCMIGRFGLFELQTVVNYLGVKKGKRDIKAFIKDTGNQWWWNDKLIDALHLNAGFYPPTVANVERFCELMLADIPQLDILGSWLTIEGRFRKELANAKLVALHDIEPFFAPKPWTWALEGKRVLVVHPFCDSIVKQYQKRDLLFPNNLLPQFELKTVKAVQSIAGTKPQFGDWFEALDSMKKELDSIDFDICIIGAGAYGFPLAAHVKRSGKKAVHLGGVTQMLFGIIGKRWEEYVDWPYSNLFNEQWVRPDGMETPGNAQNVEGACYW